MHCVDLGESFPTRIYLQNLASIQPRTSLVKFARSPRTDRPGDAPPRAAPLPGDDPWQVTLPSLPRRGGDAAPHARHAGRRDEPAARVRARGAGRRHLRRL